MATTQQFYRPHEGDDRPHGEILMAWPGPKNQNYTTDEIQQLKGELAAVAKVISRYQHVTLLVHSQDVPEAEKTFRTCGSHGIDVQSIEMEDLEFWVRDTAPTFVLADGSSHSNSGLHGIDFNFNGWGGRYPSTNTAGLARQILTDRSIPRVKTTLVLEGGALETDGDGTLLLTESSILNPNRNPNLSKEAVEKELCRLLGATKTIWIPGIKDFEVTDAHIDAWVRFAAPGKVIINDPGPHRPVLSDVYNTTKKLLSQATDAKGRQLEIINLPEAGIERPDPIDPERALNYVNYLLVPGAVILPRLGWKKADEEAREITQGAFPERKVEQVELDMVAWTGGGIHCVTQEVFGGEGGSGGSLLSCCIL